MTDNGKQFAEKPFSLWCKELQIKKVFSSVAYPQSNGQVEGIKVSLGRYGNNWLEELPRQGYPDHGEKSHGKTPYSMIFGSKVVIPAEIRVKSRRVRNIYEEAMTMRFYLTSISWKKPVSRLLLRKPDTRRSWKPSTTQG
ncbi:uncharacterized protein LOC143626551 [Bidens hawaiensis]|uniref:uncharacterized protein LOC143626551 n=1 Tax=Bidens hawaiensis TaxID=980011 RepID=UPI004049CFB2